jgi:hypothetical protein
MTLVGDLFSTFSLKKNEEFFGNLWFKFDYFFFFWKTILEFFYVTKLGRKTNHLVEGIFLKIIILKLLEVLRKIRVHYVVHHH